MEIIFKSTDTIDNYKNWSINVECKNCDSILKVFVNDISVSPHSPLSVIYKANCQNCNKDLIISFDEDDVIPKLVRRYLCNEYKLNYKKKKLKCLKKWYQFWK